MEDEAADREESEKNLLLRDGFSITSWLKPLKK